MSPVIIFSQAQVNYRCDFGQRRRSVFRVLNKQLIAVAGRRRRKHGKRRVQPALKSPQDLLNMRQMKFFSDEVTGKIIA